MVIPFFLSSFLRIRQMEHWEPLLILPLVAAFISDAFALFAGMAFGRHKLAPELSPKKTVEGAVGGFVGTVVCTVLYGVLLRFAFGYTVNYLYLALYGSPGQRHLPDGRPVIFLYQAAVRNQGFRQHFSRTRRRAGPV